LRARVRGSEPPEEEALKGLEEEEEAGE
jgi:hypothetical protein